MNKILFITPSAYIYGGLATWLDYLVPGLENSGWDVTVGLVSGRWHNAALYSKRHSFRRTLAIENESGSQEGRIRAICRAIEKVSPQLVVGVNIPDTYAAVERLRIKGNFSQRAVMTVHGLYPELFEDMSNSSEVLDGVICTNKLTCALSERCGEIERSRVHYASYGVKVPDRKPKDTKGAPLKILYVGRLGEDFQKRVSDLPLILDALEKRDLNYEFKIAGSGNLEDNLKESLSKGALNNKVTFLGALFGEDLPRTYEWADVMLLTSFWETGPIVAWEAMAHGVVVVSSAYVGMGIEDSLKDGENCILFPVGDIDKAANCLIKAEDLKLREKLSENGYKLVLEKYTREISVGLWDRALKEILSAEKKGLPTHLTKIQPAGRLDNMFGVPIAENIREFFGLRFNHSEAGGEWPHTYSEKAQDDKNFWDIAKALDGGVAE